jgi:hypothetical protein
VNVNVEAGGRWVLGDPFGQCPHCKAPNTVKHAQNGRAEVWHAPTNCCEWSRARERKFDAASREDAHRAREHHERASERAA